MVGSHPRYMHSLPPQPEIHISNIYEDRLPNKAWVALSAFQVAMPAGFEIFKRPFNGSMKDSWKTLDQFNIDEAIIYSDTSIETWIRHPHHWDVAITNFKING